MLRFMVESWRSFGLDHGLAFSRLWGPLTEIEMNLR
jgi:hypothetical protein